MIMNETNFHKPKIAIVIPVHNRRELTLSCLERLKIIDKRNFEADVVVVDDGSTDGTSEAIKEKHNNVILIYGDGNLWWSGAVNVGAAYAVEKGYDYVLTMNDDIEFENNFLQILFDTSNEYENSLVSSLSLIRGVLNNDEIIAAIGFKISGRLRHIFPSVDNKTLSSLPKEDIFCDALPGRSLLIPIKVFKTIGFFDEKRFPHGHGDIEFTYRAKLEGFSPVVNPESKIYTQLNKNYFPVYLVNANKLDFIRNLFNIKYGYGFKLMRSLSYMHKPIHIGCIDYIYRFIRLFKWILMKMILPKTYLKACISKKINMTLYGPYME